MNVIHCFDVKVAEKYGVNCAIILYNLEFWIKHNEVNGKNFHDCKYWTFNSTKAFSELFPYMSQRQIETSIKKLRDDGIIITGNFNETKYDRTLWYAITEKGKCILHQCEMDFTPNVNGFDTDVKPIPYINKDINSNINTNIYRDIEDKCQSSDGQVKDKCQHRIGKDSIDKDSIDKEETDSSISELNTDVQAAFKSFMAMRKKIKKPMTDNAINRMVEKLKNLSSNPDDQVKILNQSEDSCWSDIYPLKNKQKEKGFEGYCVDDKEDELPLPF